MGQGVGSVDRSIDRFAMLSQSAKESGNATKLFVSSGHLAHLDDKIDTLGTNYPLNIPTSFTPSMHIPPQHTNL